jgi:hypothetical protein
VKSPKKGELCHASDPLRNLTWLSGTVPTREQQRLFIKKMCSPLLLFVGTKSMNVRMDNRKVYDLAYGSIRCPETDVSIENSAQRAATQVGALLGGGTRATGLVEPC